jgi:gamma-glutamyltranspeptidase / glutathione hydrolase
MKRVGFGALAVALCCGALVAVGASAHPQAHPVGPLVKQPVAYGSDGGAATVSPYATAAAIHILQHGGNAVDAAVAAATTLGVTEPFVAGPGGGGYFVYYSARNHRVYAIDGREKTPAGGSPTMFLDSSGKPLPFETAVESGVSVGVPGQVATWGVAEDHFGSMSMRKVLKPAEEIADRGFRLDLPLVSSITGQKAKLAHFAPSAAFYLPGGNVPPIGYLLRNPDLAETYREIGDHGWRWFYTGPIAREIAQTVQHPPTAPGTPPVAGGTMTARDMADYTAPIRNPATWNYRGYQLFGMPPSSSGGLTIGEAMNILENFNQSGDDRVTALFRYLEATKLAFADRGQYDGDTDFVDVPIRGLLSKGFARQRAALIGDTALPTPVAPGDPWPFNGSGSVKAYTTTSADHEHHTNHLVVADRWGNVVSYTNTIEQIAGSGILLPHRGFLLNNELTDFNFTTGTANSPAADKRPRSSMSPTIVMRDGRVVEAIGSPGGSTIITTVLQVLLNQIDFGMTLPEAIEAPRASNRNGATTDAEPSFIQQYGPALTAKGETLAPPAPSSPLLPTYIGIAAGLQMLPHGKLETATESWRGGGGSAMVVRPENQDFDESDGW